MYILFKFRYGHYLMKIFNFLYMYMYVQLILLWMSLKWVWTLAGDLLHNWYLNLGLAIYSALKRDYRLNYSRNYLEMVFLEKDREVFGCVVWVVWRWRNSNRFEHKEWNFRRIEEEIKCQFWSWCVAKGDIDTKFSFGVWSNTKLSVH